MFQHEWELQRGSGAARRIAIVDDSPEEQYLYPELVLARHVLSERDVDAVIADASDLRYEGGRLILDGEVIDLVYNRVTDFSFEEPEHKALREAYRDGAVVVTPNPHNHALLADKRNLSLLSDASVLEGWGVAPELRTSTWPTSPRPRSTSNWMPLAARRLVVWAAEVTPSSDAVSKRTIQS